MSAFVCIEVYGTMKRKVRACRKNSDFCVFVVVFEVTQSVFFNSKPEYT